MPSDRESPPSVEPTLAQDQIADIHSPVLPTNTGELNPENITPEPNTALSYQLKSGETVYARDREEAIRMCPKLGELAVEEPEKVDGIIAAANMVQNLGLGERRPAKSEHKPASDSHTDPTVSEAAAESRQTKESKTIGADEEQARHRLDTVEIASTEANNIKQPDRKVEDILRITSLEDVTGLRAEINKHAEINGVLAWEKAHANALQAESLFDRLNPLAPQPVAKKQVEAPMKAGPVHDQLGMLAERPAVSKRIEIVSEGDATSIEGELHFVQPNVRDEIPSLVPIDEIVPVIIDAQAEVHVTQDEATTTNEGEPLLDQAVDVEPGRSLVVGEPDGGGGVAETFDEHKEDEFDIDKLLADLETGMQMVEAEYIGELLVGMLNEIDETDAIVEQKVESILTDDFETQDTESQAVESAVFVDLEAEFGLYLELLEPDQVVAAKVVMEELSVALIDSQRQREDITKGDTEVMDQQIEELCVALFEYLDIEYDEETIAQYIQNIKSIEFIETTDTEELSIEALNNLGTHEYKPIGDNSLLGSLMQFIKQKMQPYLTLGKYTLQMCTI
jgi:hypothetical protein